MYSLPLMLLPLSSYLLYLSICPLVTDTFDSPRIGHEVMTTRRCRVGMYNFSSRASLIILTFPLSYQESVCVYANHLAHPACCRARFLLASLCAFVRLFSPSLAFASLPSPRFFCPYLATRLSPAFLAPTTPRLALAVLPCRRLVLSLVTSFSSFPSLGHALEATVSTDTYMHCRAWAWGARGVSGPYYDSPSPSPQPTNVLGSLLIDHCRCFLLPILPIICAQREHNAVLPSSRTLWVHPVSGTRSLPSLQAASDSA